MMDTPPPRFAILPACVLLSIASFACVVMVKYPPIQDLPAHLLVSRIIAAPQLFAPEYVADLKPSPYVAFYAIAALLQQFMPPLLAGKLIVAAAVTSLPWSLILLVRALGGRPSAIHLAAFPICFSSVYYIGLVNYLIGVPFVFAGLAAAARLFEDRPRWRDAVGFVACALAAYFAHPIALALLAILTAALITARWRVARHARPHVLVALFAAMVVLPAWTLAVSAAAGATSREMQFVGPRFTTWFLIDPFVGTDAAPWHWFSRLAYAAIAAVCGVVARRALGARPTWRSIGANAAAWPLVVMLAVSLVLIFALPFRVGVSGNYFNVRIVLVAHLLAVAAAGVIAGGALRRWEKALLGIALALLMASTLSTHVRFDREARPAESLFAAMAPGRRVLPLAFDPRSRVLARRRWNQLYLHFHEYYHVEKGGIDPYIDQWNPLFPFHYVGPPLKTPGEYHAKAFRFAKHGGEYDYIVVRGTPPDRVMEELLANTRIVTSAPPWLLVERLDARGRGSDARGGEDAP